MTVALGCSEPPSAECPSAAQLPLVGATPIESYLGLSPQQARAIVRIAGAPPSGGTCSGTFIAPDWVLTAAHCLEIQDPLVFATEAEQSEARAVIGQLRHPTLDMALLHVSPEAASNTSPVLAPLAPDAFGASAVLAGDGVELAGYGEDEAGKLGSLQFLVKSVAFVDEGSIVTKGDGRSGACEGDSGGPMLRRENDGRVAVVGVLTLGEASCRGEDAYARVAAAAQWLQQALQGFPEYSAPCGQLTPAGRCFGSRAVWCDGDTTQAADCEGKTSCGWSADARGFRCVSSDRDPCQGAGSFGRCNEGEVLSCDEGVLQRSSCGARSTCSISPPDGRAACRPE